MLPIVEKWENDVLTIRQLIDFTAKKYGEKPCIKYVSDDEVISKSYIQFRFDSYKAAGVIIDAVGTRKHVAMIGKTSYSYLAFFNGIFVSSNIAVPMASDSPAEETAQLIDMADVCCVIYDNAYEEKFCAIKEKLGDKIVGINFDKVSLDALQNFTGNIAENDPDECAAIIYTSGTTGVRKGAMLSSRAIISNVYFEEMSYEGEHSALNVLPMHHIFCFSCDYLKNLKDGVTLCLNLDIKNVGQNLLRFEPTVIRLVPMIIESLLRKVRIIRKRNPSLTPREAAEKVFGRKLVSIIASGAYLSPKVAAEFEDMGIYLRQGYGMTETGPRISVPNGKTDIDSVGVIISICRARIQDGEVQVKSPSLMMGYYKNDEETEKVFTSDGWFRTGDMGRIGPDRQLYITGRLKNVIILSNGENVSPEEIEKKFIDVSLVKEVMVYGEDDRITAEIYPDYEWAENNGIDNIEQALEQIVSEINRADTTMKEIARIKIRQTPFERTSTGKIIRKTVKYTD